MEDQAITKANLKEIKHASAEDVKAVSDGVVNLNVDVARANIQLDELNGNLYKLKKTLEENERLSGLAKSKMQDIIPHL